MQEAGRQSQSLYLCLSWSLILGGWVRDRITPLSFDPGLGRWSRPGNDAGYIFINDTGRLPHSKRRIAVAKVGLKSPSS